MRFISRGAMVLLLLLLLLTGCGSGMGFQPTYTLPSGQSYPIVEWKVTYSLSGPSTMKLAYETALPFTDIRRIDAEVAQVWEAFRHDAEKAGHARAIVQASSPDEGTIFFYVRKTRTHVFVQSRDGAWVREAE